MKGITISANYIYKRSETEIRATEGQSVVLVDGTTIFGAEIICKYLQTHIEVLKQCITVLVRVPINNYNYVQPN